MVATAAALCADAKSFTSAIGLVNPLGAKPSFVTAGRPNASHGDKSHTSPGASNSSLGMCANGGPETIAMIVNGTYQISIDSESTSRTTTCPHYPHLSEAPSAEKVVVKAKL